MIEFKTINERAIGIITEKRSKFIATIIPISSQKEAEAELREHRKKYSDAKHNCYAYCILEDENKITKSSDDGEPSGTAGIPILKVIKENNLCNVIIIVTRYFGGILLGTGGLQRAYTDASIESIKNSNILINQIGYEIELQINYADFNYLKYYIKQTKGTITNIEYNEGIKVKIEVTQKSKEELEDVNSNIGNKIQKIYNIDKKYIAKNTSI